jgi:hypothetical protein
MNGLFDSTNNVDVNANNIVILNIGVILVFGDICGWHIPHLFLGKHVDSNKLDDYMCVFEPGIMFFLTRII